MVLLTRQILSVYAELMLKLRNTFFRVVTFILPKDLNSSLILRKLTQTLKILVVKTKFHFCYTVQKQIDQNTIKILLKL